MAAAYEVTFNCTDDESFQFGFKLLDDDGVPFDWDVFICEYALNGDCGPDLSLSLGNGITAEMDADDEEFIRIAAEPGFRLRAGQYRHGFRVVEIANGSTRQIFDGSVTCTEGNFR